MKKLLYLLFTIISVLDIQSAFSQKKHEAINEDTSQVNKHKGFSVSGYIQTQYQFADSMGAPARFNGGDFARFSQNRFTIRRGRLKIMHTSTFSEAAFAFDINERGLQVKDVYLTLKEPWINTFSLTSGIFYVPFGYELGYSSALRESPERSRMVQTLFPMERDLGVMLTINPPEKYRVHFLKVQAGIFNGNSINQETDVFKDYCARVQISNPFPSKLVDYSIGGSYYNGGLNYVYNNDGKPLDHRYVFSMKTLDNGNLKGFDLDSSMSFKDTAAFHEGKIGGTRINRIYYGADAQISFNFPFGKTTLRGEYITGTQASPIYTLGAGIKYQSFYNWNSSSYTGYMMGVSWPIYDSPQPVNPAAVLPTAKLYDVFIRKFRGVGFYLVQDIWKTGLQVIFKYDFYDPNTKVKGKEVDFNIYQRDSTGNLIHDTEGNLVADPNTATFLSPADVKFTTYGFGINYNYKNFMVMVYYDLVKNEITNLSPYQGDISKGQMPNPGFRKDQKDNILTIRLQYKF
ncbi:MAG: hypothetical protein WCL06_04855 [Bacteroidota bacterium]